MTEQRNSRKQASSSSWALSPGFEGRPKRRKISQACQQCRTRKSRCDGAKPVCGECASRPGQATQCRYSSNQHKNQDYDDYVSSLLARINELEAVQNQSIAFEFQTTPAADGREHASQLISHESGSSYTPRPSLEEPQQSSANPSPIDAMGADNSIDHRQQEVETRYYGDSSATSLMQQVYQAVGNLADASRAPSPLPGSDRLGVLNAFDRSWDGTPIESFLLLPRQLTDTILAVYWDKIHHLYPFLHKPTFMAAYERLWSPQSLQEMSSSAVVSILGSKDYGHDSYIFHCALNGMLALATQFMDASFSNRDKLAQMFATKSRSLCKLDLFDDGSLACIQTLLLMTMHLQSTPFPNRCWNCIGIACRLAQGLGLYIESPRLLAKATSLELEMRRRVWHGCVMLDTIVSTTLGRPMMLHRFTPSPLPMPSPVDDDYLADPQTQPQAHVSWLCFYVESIKLYEILAEVIANVYGKTNLHPASSEKEYGIEHITRIDTAISSLENKVPEHLQASTQSFSEQELLKSPTFKQQAFVLRARYLHLRLLLYRPCFLRFWHRLFAAETGLISKPAQESSVSDVSLIVTQAISSGCVEKSIELIELIRKSLADCSTGAWWYNLLYVRTAGIIIVLSLSCNAVVNLIGGDNLQIARSNCLSLLKDLRERSPSAVKCLEQLERMYRYLVNIKSKQSDPSRSQAATSAVPESSDRSRSLHPLNAINDTSCMGMEQRDSLSEFEFTIFDEMFNFSSQGPATGYFELDTNW